MPTDDRRVDVVAPVARDPVAGDSVAGDPAAAGSRPACRRIRLVLRYDGTDYLGWQRQARGSTVQAAVEDTLATIIGESVEVSASGRTDAGVHALGQVAHFTTASRHAPRTIQRAMNARLPHDVAVVDAGEAPPEFHARFSARRKTYCYQFHVGDQEDPFLRRYFQHLFRAPDVSRMREAAAVLVGTHDFRSFTVEAGAIQDTVRTIFAIRVLRLPAGVRVFVTGNGFLQHMVRTLAGVLLQAGRGVIDVDGVARILAARDRRAAPATLPARGLFLWKVDY